MSTTGSRTGPGPGAAARGPRPTGKGLAVGVATVAGVAGVLLLNPSTPLLTAVAGSATDPQGSAVSASGSATTYTGQAYSSPYGPMQVQASIDNGQIIDISWVQLPGDHHSRQINATAAPRLVAQALAAQSAHVDSIGGASFTSAGFTQSLQSALTQAGL